MADQAGVHIDRRQTLIHQYEQVCISYRAIDDFRGRLLALWPILGGAAGGVALFAFEDINGMYLFPIGLFGFLVSTGLAVYEWNQTLRCDQLKKSARQLERRMGFDVGTGQFLSLPRGFRLGATGPPLTELRWLLEQEDVEREGRPAPPDRASIVDYPIRVGVASLIVYGSVILGWFGILAWGAVVVWWGAVVVVWATILAALFQLA
jgi:hypothetical protein